MISLYTNAGVFPCLMGDGLDEIDCDDVADYSPSYIASRLPLPPPPTKPKARIGQFFWPCWGMTRYAVGHVVITGESLAKIVTGWGSGSRFVDVTFTDNRNDPWSMSMFVHSCRPYADPRPSLLKTVDPSIEQAWILTIVDKRYRYQDYINMGFAGPVATWGDLLKTATSYSVFLGGGGIPKATFDSLLAGSPAYPDPDFEFWSSAPYVSSSSIATGAKVESDACYLDAAFAAVNLRWARGANYATATNPAQNSALAKAAWDSWVAAYGSRSVSGGLVSDIEGPKEVQGIFHNVGTGSVLDPGYPSRANATALPGGFVSTVAEFGPCSNPANHTTRYAADMAAWYAVGTSEMKLAGLLPPPESAAIYGVVLTSNKSEVSTRIVKGPATYPWPMRANRDRYSVYHPLTNADAQGLVNSIYFSTTQGKLVYKDSGGVVRNLY